MFAISVLPLPTESLELPEDERGCHNARLGWG